MFIRTKKYRSQGKKDPERMPYPTVVIVMTTQ